MWSKKQNMNFLQRGGATFQELMPYKIVFVWLDIVCTYTNI